LRVAVSDIATYERFFTEALSLLPGIANLTSRLTMKQVKIADGIPLGQVDHVGDGHNPQG